MRSAEQHRDTTYHDHINFRHKSCADLPPRYLYRRCDSTGRGNGNRKREVPGSPAFWESLGLE